MSTKDKWILPLAIFVGLVLQGFVLGWSLGPSTDGVGAVVTGPNIENYVPAIQQNRGIRTAFDIYTSSGITVGADGSDINEFIVSTCNLAMGNASVAMTATSSRWFACTGLTGIASGDVVFGALPGIPHGRTLWANEFTVGAVQASSTAGAVDVQLFYWGNVSTSSFAQATTSFKIISIDN